MHNLKPNCFISYQGEMIAGRVTPSRRYDVETGTGNRGVPGMRRVRGTPLGRGWVRGRGAVNTSNLRGVPNIRMIRGTLNTRILRGAHRTGWIGGGLKPNEEWSGGS